MKNIILVGFMGSGKTEIGKTVSEKVELVFVDSDNIIEKQFGNIKDIFDKKGEQYFRKLEYLTIKKIFDIYKKPIVLSVGGGAFCEHKTSRLLSQNGVVFFLDCPFEICYNRISRTADRPLVKNGKESLRTLYRKRHNFYQKADFRIDASKSINTIVKTILLKLNETY